MLLKPGQEQFYWYTGNICTRTLAAPDVVPFGFGCLFSPDHKVCVFAEFENIIPQPSTGFYGRAIPRGNCEIYDSDGSQWQGCLAQMNTVVNIKTKSGFVKNACTSLYACMNSTFVQYENATGKFMSTQEFKKNQKTGSSCTSMSNGYVFDGRYKDDKRVGVWKVTEPDGSWYTTEYSKGDEILEKRSTKTRLSPAFVNDGLHGRYKDGKRVGVWTVTEPDGSWYTTEYSKGDEILEKRSTKTRPSSAFVDEQPNEITEEAAELIVAKKRYQRERAFLNKTAEEWRKKYPGAEITTEHPVGSKSIDLLAKLGDIVAVGEFKASIKTIPHAVGQVQFYRRRLCDVDSDAATARREGNLVTFVAVPTEPDQEDVDIALLEASVHTWWPGQSLPF